MIHKLTTYADPTIDRQFKEIELALKPLTGTADPTGTVTPRWLGDWFFDANAGQWYVSTGNTSADWQLNGSGGGGGGLTTAHSGHAGIIRIDPADITTHLNTSLYVRVAANTGIFVSGGVLTSVLTIAGITADTHALADDITNYIVADYNGGSPTFDVITDESLIDYLTVIPYAEIYKRSGSNSPHTQMTTLRNLGEAEYNHHRMYSVDRYGVESGMDGIAVDTSLKITGNAGVVWAGNYRYSITSITSATTHFVCVYDGAWTITAGTNISINNTQYNDISSGMVDLTAGHFGMVYLYRGIENEDHLYLVYGFEEYANADLAKAAGLPPTIPAIIDSHAMLIGRVIYEKGATIFTAESAIGRTFNGSSAVNTHNSLMGLQGGDLATQYYHLSSAEHSNVQALDTAAYESAAAFATAGHTHAQLHDRQHSVIDTLDHTFPGGTTTFLRADGTFAAPSGTAANSAFNTSTAAQNSIGTGRVYVIGSRLVPAAFKVGTILRWTITVTKTAAGTAAPTVDIAFGTAGTTADTARVTFTMSAQTAVADTAVFEITAVVRGPISTACIVQGTCKISNRVSYTTGFKTQVVAATSAAFTITTASLGAGICFTPGASAAWSISNVIAEVLNI